MAIASKSASTLPRNRSTPATGATGRSVSQHRGRADIFGQNVIDGVVVIHEGGPTFSELQAELVAGKQGRLVCYAFDLLWRDGDIRASAKLAHSQTCWARTTSTSPSYLIGDGHEMFRHVAKLNWKGIVSKNAAALVMLP